MADENTGADALGQYLTGAGADGATQPDPDASLGNYRAAERVDTLGVLMAQGPPGLRIERVSGYNGAGAASLVAVGADAVAWRPPDGTQGEAVTIADGETRQVGGADAPDWATMSLARWAELTVDEWATTGVGGSGLDGFAVVTRRSAEPLAGEFTAHLDPVVGNVVGGSRQTVSGEAYRCLCLKNTTGDGHTLGLWHLGDVAGDGLSDVATTAHALTNYGAEHVIGEGYRWVRADSDQMEAAFPGDSGRSVLTMECWMRDFEWLPGVWNYGRLLDWWKDTNNALYVLALVHGSDPALSRFWVTQKIGGVTLCDFSWMHADAHALLIGADPIHVQLSSTRALRD